MKKISTHCISSLPTKENYILFKVVTENGFAKLGKKIKDQAVKEGFDPSSDVMLFASSNDHCIRQYFIGSKLDSKSKCTITQEKIGATIYDIAAKLKTKDNHIVISFEMGLGRNIVNIASNIWFGFMQKAYRFDKYLTQEKHLKNLPSIATVSLYINEKNVSNLNSNIQKMTHIVDSIYLVRDLVNEPANILYPESFAEIAKRELQGLPQVSITVLGQKELIDMGANLLAGVGIGSSKESKVVVVSYHGIPELPIIRPHLALVGKGVTFDSGGLSLKPADSMEDMKGDMAGAATVLGTIKLLAKNKTKVNVVGLMGLVENMPSGNAQKPGDVVTSLSGQTVEILNTDAEGRLVLADLLYYAQKNYQPEYMIDLATLTGAIVVALGSTMAGLYSNSDALATKLLQSGLETGDLCWRMPLGEPFDKMMNSKIADMKNISGKREAGSITAAAFLQRFIGDNKNWAHLDIAGVSDHGSDQELHVAGGSGFGVKLLNHFIEKNFKI